MSSPHSCPQGRSPATSAFCKGEGFSGRREPFAMLQELGSCQAPLRGPWGEDRAVPGDLWDRLPTEGRETETQLGKGPPCHHDACCLGSRHSDLGVRTSTWHLRAGAIPGASKPRCRPAPSQAVKRKKRKLGRRDGAPPEFLHLSRRGRSRSQAPASWSVLGHCEPPVGHRGGAPVPAPPRGPSLL